MQSCTQSLFDRPELRSEVERYNSRYGEMRDRLPSVEIDSDLRRKIVAQSNLVSARRTLALAKIRCLSFKEQLRRLKRGLEEEYFDELAFAVGEAERSVRQNA